MSYNFFHPGLRSKGLRDDNENTLDMVSTKAAKRKVNPKAYCTSPGCLNKVNRPIKERNAKLDKGEKPELELLEREVVVPKSSIFCPHCGHALFWVCEDSEWTISDPEQEEYSETA